jgi:hypothetical protein
MLEFGFQLDSLAYKHTVGDMRTELRLAESGLVPDRPERNYCVSRGVFPLLVRKEGEKSKVSVSISCLLALKSTGASRIQNGVGNHSTKKIGDTRK